MNKSQKASLYLNAIILLLAGSLVGMCSFLAFTPDKWWYGILAVLWLAVAVLKVFTIAWDIDAAVLDARREEIDRNIKSFSEITKLLRS